MLIINTQWLWATNTTWTCIPCNDAQFDLWFLREEWSDPYGPYRRRSRASSSEKHLQPAMGRYWSTANLSHEAPTKNFYLRRRLSTNNEHVHSTTEQMVDGFVTSIGEQIQKHISRHVLESPTTCRSRRRTLVCSAQRPLIKLDTPTQYGSRQSAS
jgi:hypothetical protein